MTVWVFWGQNPKVIVWAIGPNKVVCDNTRASGAGPNESRKVLVQIDWQRSNRILSLSDAYLNWSRDMHSIGFNKTYPIVSWYYISSPGFGLQQAYQIIGRDLFEGKEVVQPSISLLMLFSPIRHER